MLQLKREVVHAISAPVLNTTYQESLSIWKARSTRNAEAATSVVFILGPAATAREKKTYAGTKAARTFPSDEFKSP